MFENFSFLEILVLFLVGGLFFKEQLWALIQSRFGGAEKEKPKAERLNEDAPEWAQQLVQHFNHDTTQQHDRTHEILSELMEMERVEHKASDTMRDLLKDMSRTLEYMERNGVNCRK